MLHFVPLLCVTLLVRVEGKGAKGVNSEEKWTTKVRPDYLKRFEHGISFEGPATPGKKKAGDTTATTQYVEPEFKRFCNECEDYWHPNCHHYPHIYDDSRGCVLKTLSPKEVAQMDKSSEEEGSDAEYEEEEEEQGDKEYEEQKDEEGGETKQPEVLMKADELEAMRQRFNQLNTGDKPAPNVNGTEPLFNQGQIDAMAGKFVNATTLQEERDEIMKHTIPNRQTNVSTTAVTADTILFSVEHGRRITLYKELLDDAESPLDMTINNALLSCPREFAISQSSIPDIQLGVWTKVALPAGVVMGPYRGQVSLTRSHEEDTAEKAKPEEHILNIFHPKTRQLLFIVDGRSNTLGNWCRYINAARHTSEQNIEVFFDPGKPFPYFRTIKPIEKNTELLCDFGGEYRKGKYTNLVNVQYTQPLMEPLPRRKFPCSRCGEDQRNPVAVQRHRKACNATKPKKTPRPKKIKHIIQDEDDEEVEVVVTSYSPPKHTKPRPNRPKRH